MSRQQLVDAVIVGSGLGGSTLAYRLGELGLCVLVVEEGEYLPRRTWLPGDPVGLPIKSFYGPQPPSLVGGLTKFYGGAMYRFRQIDFRSIAHEAGVSPEWPITYSELEPYYLDAERLYRVHGSTEGDTSEPPRSAGFPYPPIPHAHAVSDLIERLRAGGISVSSIPLALDYGVGGKCVLCSTCDSYYCQLGAKMDAEIGALQPALKNFNVEIMTGARCVRVLTSNDGAKAIGIVVLHDGIERTIYACTVAVCAGLPGSARILIQSRTTRHPRGLGNSTDCVGRFVAGHTTKFVFPMLNTEHKIEPTHTKTFAINGYYEGCPDWPYPMGVIQAAGQAPFWERNIVSRWAAERSVGVFCMTEALPSHESGFHFQQDSLVGFRKPLENNQTFTRLCEAASELFGVAGCQVVSSDHRYLWHPTGSVIFGHDPNCSVLDLNCRVHDIDNLYVVDASVLPSAAAVNTGLTIAALALRTGDAIGHQQEHSH